MSAFLRCKRDWNVCTPSDGCEMVLSALFNFSYNPYYRFHPSTCIYR